MQIAHPRGNYHFLQGIEPYSCGVIADPGYEIVHATVRPALHWRDGFSRIEAWLDQADRPRAALCAVELRSPAPFTMQGFIDFNSTYCEVLESWELYVDGLNPVARTNVAPVLHPPAEVALHAFSYTRPCTAHAEATLIVSGAGELREGLLEEHRIIRPGDTSAAAMREKAAYVMEVMTARLCGLGVDWGSLSCVDVYTAHLHAGLLEEQVLTALHGAADLGALYYQARPPIIDIDFEMDMRGVATELRLS